MRLDLLGWRIEGLRSADFEISLTDENGRVPRVALIQMPNGTGKTTTLQCLRAALTGEAISWTPDEVRSFRKTANDAAGTGRFDVRLRVDARLVTFGMVFDFTEGQITYQTTFGRGQNDRWVPPPELRRFLNPHFVNLLVFDGELPEQLLDRSETRAEAAIEAFFQLYLLDEASDSVDEVWRRQTRGITATDQTGLTRRRNKVEQIRTHLAALQRRREAIDEELQDLAPEIGRIESEIQTHISSVEGLQSEYEDVQARLTGADERLTGQLDKLMTAVRQPQLAHPSFSSNLTALLTHLDQLRLPESTSREFFDELAVADECICGRPLDDHTREELRRRAEHYLASDISGIINHLKLEIRRYVLDAEPPQQPTDDQAGAVVDAVHNRDTISTEKETIHRQLIQAGGTEVQQKQVQLDELKQRRNALREEYEELAREPRLADDETSRCIKAVRNQLDEAEQRLAEVTDTVQLRADKELIQRILHKARQRAEAAIKDSVIFDVNQTLDRLLPEHRVRVEGLARSIVLEGRGGASMGQTLAVGYAFLSTLFHRGHNEFPFIVDAPVIALDSNVRREVGTYLPSVCSQFAAFVLDTEREAFVASLEESSGADVLYLTAFEDSPRNEDLLNRSSQVDPQMVTRSEDGVVVRGRNFFDAATFTEEAREGTEELTQPEGS
jgi:DNA sulfur modification protein DndD